MTAKAATQRRKAQAEAAEQRTCQQCLQEFDFKLNTNSDGERLCDTCLERLNRSVNT